MDGAHIEDRAHGRFTAYDAGEDRHPPFATTPAHAAGLALTNSSRARGVQRTRPGHDRGSPRDAR